MALPESGWDYDCCHACFIGQKSLAVAYFGHRPDVRVGVCSLLCMDAVGKISGRIGLPEYEGYLPFPYCGRF